MKAWLAVAAMLLAGSALGQVKKHHQTAADLRHALSNIQQKKAHLKHELAHARAETHEVKVNINEIDTSLSDLEGDLEATTDSLNASVREQGQLATQLQQATARVGVVRGQVSKRLRYMYMHQGESVLSAFIGAKSVGDIASRKVILEAIARKDRSLFTEFRTLRAQISDHKRRQDVVVTRVADLKHRQLNYQDHLQSTRHEKGLALKSLQSQQDQLKNLLNQLEEDEASVYSEIRAYEAAAARAPHVPGRKAPPAFIGRFLKPAQGPITSTFRMRMDPILHRWLLHAGIDFGAPYGSPIRAAGDGTVIVARYSHSYGNMVVIDHGNGLSTLYGHGSRLYVHVGQVVKRGQIIAAVGQTGFATGPHLHWEVRINGRPVNPMGRF